MSHGVRDRTRLPHECKFLAHVCPMLSSSPSNTRRLSNVDVMHADRLRRLPNCKSTLGHHPMHTGSRTPYFNIRTLLNS